MRLEEHGADRHTDGQITTLRNAPVITTDDRAVTWRV